MALSTTTWVLSPTFPLFVHPTSCAQATNSDLKDHQRKCGELAEKVSLYVVLSACMHACLPVYLSVCLIFLWLRCNITSSSIYFSSQVFH